MALLSNVLNKVKQQTSNLSTQKTNTAPAPSGLSSNRSIQPQPISSGLTSDRAIQPQPVSGGLTSDKQVQPQPTSGGLSSNIGLFQSSVKPAVSGMISTAKGMFDAAAQKPTTTQPVATQAGRTPQESNLYNYDPSKVNTADQYGKSMTDYLKNTDATKQFDEIANRFGYDENASDEIKQAQQEYIDKLKNSPEQLKMFDEELKNAGFYDRKTELDAMGQKLTDMYSTIMNTEAEVRQQYPNASESQVKWLAERRTKTLVPEYNRLNNGYTNLKGSLDTDYNRALERSGIGLEDALRKERGFEMAVNFAVDNYGRARQQTFDFYDVFTSERDKMIDTITGSYEAKQNEINRAFSPDMLLSGSPPPGLPQQYMDTWNKASQKAREEFALKMEQGYTDLGNSMYRGEERDVNGRKIVGTQMTPEQEAALSASYARSSGSGRGGGGGGVGVGNGGIGLENIYNMAFNDVMDGMPFSHEAKSWAPSEIYNYMLNNDEIYDMLSQGMITTGQLQEFVNNKISNTLPKTSPPKSAVERTKQAKKTFSF